MAKNAAQLPVDSRITANNLYLDPLLSRYKNDPRFTRLRKEFGLPAPDEPLPGVGAGTAATASHEMPGGRF